MSAQEKNAPGCASQKPTSPFICKAAIAVLSLFFLMRLKKKDNCWRYVVLLYRQTESCFSYYFSFHEDTSQITSFFGQAYERCIGNNTATNLQFH